ncbi:MAG: Na/Pi cotransporter family protein [Ruminococcaceae bacterium]|nr:Na/Pi cotransporter family protein [Oscillospiraceae bacterium]
MDIFDVLTMIGGLCLFLFGMNIMGQALERRAGSSLRSLLGKMTSKKFVGLLTGMAVTAVIQSSSATTVMVVGFVNSGLMTLKQAINVIMGANVGTTITSWILSLSGIDSGNVFVKLLKPTSFTPILALVGVVYYVFMKNDKKKDTGLILLGFATLMFGMDTMSDAVSGLADIPAFQQLFIMFQNPLLGLLAGALLTAIIQSSSASVGILQALAVTGQVTFGAAVPIIMGQNIGTCVTAMLSSVGANKNAKRAALVHLSFNIIGSLLLLAVYCIIKAIFKPLILDESASMIGIAVFHSIFNVLCTIILLPMSGLLEKLVCKLVPDSEVSDTVEKLDERLLTTPPLAIKRCHDYTIEMANCAVNTLKSGLTSLTGYTPELAQTIRDGEDATDLYEDSLGTYLVKLSGTRQLSNNDSETVTKLLKMIGDFERISDHGVNLLMSVEEIREKGIILTDGAQEELKVLFAAVDEILDLSLEAFVKNDASIAEKVEPLAQLIDKLKEKLRTRHILRMRQGNCSIEAGFVWSDMLTTLERAAGHCSNIAGCIIDSANHNLNLHESLRDTRTNSADFEKMYLEYKHKYALAKLPQ